MHLSFFIFIILGVTSCAVVSAAPSNIGAPLMNIMNTNNLCDYECPRHYSPVCAVDSSGVPRTFGNKCIAGLMYCYERKYYAIVKEGEC